MVEAKTMRPTPASTHASATRRVPRTWLFRRPVWSSRAWGSRAARWQTAVQPSTAWRVVSGSVTLPVTSSTRPSRRAGSRTSSTLTRWPAARRASTTARPSTPHPPVTSITAPSLPAGDRRIPGELVGVGKPAGGRRRRPSRLRWGALTLALIAFGLVLPGRLAATASGAPPGSGAGTRKLLVADLKGLTHDEQIVFTVLQGIVNRTSARVYYLGLLGGQDYLTDPTAELWLRDAVNLSTLRVPDPYELLLRFRKAVHGLVVWDPALKVDTQNVATTMGGLEDVLPVSPDSAKVLSAPPYSFPIVEDLRNEHFASRAAAYEWALRSFPPKREHYGLLAWPG